MRASLIRTAIAALAALILSACRDTADETSPLAPRARPDNAVTMMVKNPWEIIDITAGADHSCVRSRGGTVYCWGDNTHGEIGVQSTDTCGLYEYGLAPCVPHPTVVTGAVVSRRGTIASFTTASKVTAGGFHTCVIAGSVWCWGQNKYGEVGNGATDQLDVTSPTPVSGGPFTGLAAGAGATCGTAGTMLYCWGHVGTGTPTGATPYLMSWNTGWGDNINVGPTHACAMWQGQWGCWGDNIWGQIGADPAVWPYFDGPLGNPAFASANNVVAGGGYGYTCFDQPNTTVQCLGLNDNGQLGDWNFVDQKTYTAQTVGGQQTPRSLHNVTTGNQHACALDPQGAAWCWGKDALGQLGRGAGVSGGIVRDPAPVAGGLTFFKLAAGYNHTCGITTSYRIYCWGDNYFGQLGVVNHAAPTPNPQPVPVI